MTLNYLSPTHTVSRDDAIGSRSGVARSGGRHGHPHHSFRKARESREKKKITSVKEKGNNVNKIMPLTELCSK